MALSLREKSTISRRIKDNSAKLQGGLNLREKSVVSRAIKADVALLTGSASEITNSLPEQEDDHVPLKLFTPTHYLSDGTPAIHLEASLYADERGDEHEDNYAFPVDNATVTNQLKGNSDAAIPNGDLESNSKKAGNQKRSVQDTILDDGGRNRRGARRTGAAAGSAGDGNTSDTGLPTDRTAAVRAGSDTGMGNGDGQYWPDAGTDDYAGSGGLRSSGIFPDRDTNSAIEDIARRDAELSLKDKRVQQSDAELVDVITHDEANIRATLPFLLPEQQDDIVKIEKRFAEHHGMMITNGTGTGKTFTALGAIKRFAKQGKDSILIVVPGDKIAQDFVDSAKNLHLDIKKLDGIKDNGGEGVAVTTYANFYQNETLLERSWDLVVFDEAHKINSNQSGNMTEAQRMMRDITLHPRTLDSKIRAEINNHPRINEIIDEIEKTKEGTQGWNATREFTEQDALRIKELQSEREQIETQIKEQWQAKRSKVLFLSATPFAYEKSIDYAEGYLFDHPKTEDGGYNSSGGKERFMMQHFGYSMRYNKLTTPDARVNSGAMQRQFNEHLKETGALSGRTLQVNADYSREFIILKGRVGEQIDAGMEALRDEKYRNLRDYIWKANFAYLTRLKLLEAIKAKALVPRIKKHLALNRKVVLFHSFKVGGGYNPFVLNKSNTAWINLGYYDKIKIESQYDVFNQQYPQFQKLSLDDLASPIETFKNAFGGKIAIYNGDIPKKQILQSAKNFNDDGLDESIILMQVDKGKEGVSLHDTTGKKQRVLINLGLPVKPTDSIQIEGRIYRTGQVSNAIFEYISTGTDFEKRTFAETIAERSGTAENLAMGNNARNLMTAFTEGYLNATDAEPSEDQGTGGKQADPVTTGMSPFEKAMSDYFSTQKSSKHTKSKGVDYFPTPEPLGLKMVELANIKPGEDALEPSAGHGAIARYFPETSNNTFVEPSGQLLGDLALRTAGNGETKQATFEELSQYLKYDAVVMNPPFGHGGATAMAHLKKAMLHLKNGGRVVALIPDGGMASKAFDKLMEELPDNFYLIKTVLLPRVAFERAGTSVVTKIVVIQRFDKKADAENAGANYAETVNLRHFEDIGGLFGKLGDL